MKGVTDIARAFAIRRLGCEQTSPVQPEGDDETVYVIPFDLPFIALPEGGFPSRPDAAAEAIASRASQPVSRLPAAAPTGEQC